MLSAVAVHRSSSSQPSAPIAAPAHNSTDLSKQRSLAKIEPWTPSAIIENVVFRIPNAFPKSLKERDQLLIEVVPRSQAELNAIIVPSGSFGFYIDHNLNIRQKDFDRGIERFYASLRKSDPFLVKFGAQDRTLICFKNPIEVPKFFLTKSIAKVGGSYDQLAREISSAYHHARDNAQRLSGRHADPWAVHFKGCNTREALPIFCMDVTNQAGARQRFTSAYFRSGNSQFGRDISLVADNLSLIREGIEAAKGAIVPGYVGFGEHQYFNRYLRQADRQPTLDIYGLQTTTPANCCILGTHQRQIIVPLRRPPEDAWNSTVPEISDFLDPIRGLRYVKEALWTEFIQSRLIGQRIREISTDIVCFAKGSGKETGPRAGQGPSQLKSYNFAPACSSNISTTIYGKHYIVEVVGNKTPTENGAQLARTCAVVECETWGALRIFETAAEAKIWLSATPQERRDSGLNERSYRLVHQYKEADFCRLVNAEIERRTGVRNAGGVRKALVNINEHAQ
jgi:hypothetical protein